MTKDQVIKKAIIALHNSVGLVLIALQQGDASQLPAAGRSLGVVGELAEKWMQEDDEVVPR